VTAGRCFFAFHTQGFEGIRSSSTASVKTAFTESAMFLSVRADRGLDPSARRLPKSDLA
jgi:hypothetical protein